MTATNDAGRTPARPTAPRRRTAILLIILLLVAIPLITIAVIYPAYGAGCAITVGTLTVVLQNVHDRHHRT
ncbi:hypothetical protein FDO65_11490 [Nakamurella flava]|uniref:Uncharacterized protein n=1 Tax=Nakamurella flava TaxID=2576308 RepID=A0A4U6QGG4_9ACTN|nr:hypothetical protein [Nakamurella flava]TKV59241.1 hypothetical protein FDO65_11490 [Nakamurella flava]